MTATDKTVDAPPRAALPPELERFWMNFAAAQIRRGRRDVGGMVQAALEYLFDRGLQSFTPLTRSLEDLEAFHQALSEELSLVDEAVSQCDSVTLALAAPLVAKQFRIAQRQDDATPVEKAVVVTKWPRMIETPAELNRYKTGLQKQLEAVVNATDETQKKLMAQRLRLQNKLMPYSAAFYDVAVELVTQAEIEQQAENLRDDQAATAHAGAGPARQTVCAQPSDFEIWLGNLQGHSPVLASAAAPKHVGEKPSLTKLFAWGKQQFKKTL